MPVLGERGSLAYAGGKGALCQCWGRGRILPVLREWARLASSGGQSVPCQCWWRGRASPLGRGRACHYWGEALRALPVLEGDALSGA